jgi:hypothetical protein
MLYTTLMTASAAAMAAAVGLWVLPVGVVVGLVMDRMAGDDD